MKFPCPRCDHALEACRSLVGFSVRCPACHHPVAVPHGGKTSAPSEPAQEQPLPAAPAPAASPAEPSPADVPRKRGSLLRLPAALAIITVLGGIGLAIKNAASTSPAHATAPSAPAAPTSPASSDDPAPPPSSPETVHSE